MNSVESNVKLYKNLICSVKVISCEARFLTWALQAYSHRTVSILTVNQFERLYLINSKSDDMVMKRHRSRNYPSPEYCILDMVNAHLKMNREGRKLTRGVLVGYTIPG